MVAIITITIIIIIFIHTIAIIIACGGDYVV